MKPNQKTLAVAALLLAAFSSNAALAARPAKQAALIERGSYLVNNAGMCIDCHSPRNERGELIAERALQGAPIGFTPAAPMPWAPSAPALAGLPSMTEAQAMTFLQTGVRPDGSRPRPPMPGYRFNEADARAIVAFLKSLGK